MGKVKLKRQKVNFDYHNDLNKEQYYFKMLKHMKMGLNRTIREVIRTYGKPVMKCGDIPLQSDPHAPCARGAYINIAGEGSLPG